MKSKNQNTNPIKIKSTTLSTSKSKEIPKHLRKRKGFQAQQAKQREETQVKWQTGAVLVMIVVVIGAGLFAYNMDNVYIHDKNNITLSYSNNFQQSGSTPVVITLTDNEGAPVTQEDVTIELEYSQNNNIRKVTLEKGKTDSSGTIVPNLDLPDDYNGSAKLIISTSNQKLEQPITIAEPKTGTTITSSTDEQLKILISLDKPIYQPGQQINIRTLAMYGETKGVYDGDITIELTDPDGNKIFKTDQESNSYGIASTNFTVTDQMPLGNYKITAKAGEREVQKSVTVKEYVLPRFNIQFEDLKGWYTVDEEITGSINCKYFFGKPVKGDIIFNARIYYGGIWDKYYSTTGKLSEDGIFEFTVPEVEYAIALPANQDNGLVELNATIIDPSGHSETKLMPISIARQSILITAISDTNIRGVESKYYILTQAPDGSIVDDAEVTARVDQNQVFKGYSDSKGLAEVKFTYNNEETLEIEVKKGNLTANDTFDLIPGKGLKLVADKMYYEVGDLAKFNVYYSGDSYTKWVYYDLISDGFTITTGCFKLSNSKNGNGVFSIDITPDMVGTTFIRVYKIEKDEDVVSDRLELAVAPVSELNIDIEKDDDIYNPNQPVKLTFKVTEGDRAVQAALGIAIIDQSLYGLTERFGGFEDIYFELEQTALEPRYQIWEYLFDSDSETKTIPLPETNILDPSEYQKGYSYPEIGMQSNWNNELDNAENSKTNSINLYWAGIFLIGFIGLIVFAFYGIRRSKPMLVIAILGILVIATIVGGVAIKFDRLDITQDTIETETKDDGSSQTISDDVNGQKGGGGNGTPGGGFDGGIDDWDEVMEGDGIVFDDRFIDFDEMAITNAEDVGDSTALKEPGLDGDPSYKREQREVHVREYFPETWYWAPMIITDETGTAEIELTTPDSITTWEIKAIGNTKDAKLGMNNENLTVFQEFFIEPDIPVSVIRNDTFPLRIMVYNYDEIPHEITVYLEDAEWFEALDDTTKSVTVPSDNVSKVMFNIRALEVGEHNITLSGYNGKAWDDVIKPMRVDPDGKKNSDTINGKLTDNQTVDNTITLTPERVPNSENAFVKLQAGMEAVLLDGAESFIRFVSGCGEQSMSTLNIDILAFDTVQKLETVTEEKMFEYERIVTQGIEHELQYLLEAENGEGRGIVWFPDDVDVHQWLTSWGLITFQDAIDAGFELDPTIIPDMQSWLISQQEDDGSFVFPERGLYEFTNPILRAKTISCSAYITRSLIYSGYSVESTKIQNAVNYIAAHAKDSEVWDDPYSLALVLIVLEDGKASNSLRSELAARLEELKIDDTKNGTVFWSSGTSMITDSDDIGFGWGMEMSYGYGSSYHSIETTGYAVMALAKHKGSGSSTVQKGIKYLINNRQGLGGWYSTQDTVVAFQALKVAGTNNIDEITIQIMIEDYIIESIAFDENNIDLTYLIDLRPYLQETTKVTIKSIGTGSIMYQIYYEEFIPWALSGLDRPQELILNISYDATDIKVNDQIEASLELKYLGSAEHIKMVLVDLRAPVGFSFVEDDFKDMKNTGKISQYELNDRQGYLYIENLNYGQILILTYHLVANDPIRGTIQGINAFDMYNPNLIAEVGPVDVTVSD